MAVYVDEIHTDVVPAVAPVSQPGQQADPEKIATAENAWRESRRADLMSARRTAAEGFDD